MKKQLTQLELAKKEQIIEKIFDYVIIPITSFDTSFNVIETQHRMDEAIQRGEDISDADYKDAIDKTEKGEILRINKMLSADLIDKEKVLERFNIRVNEHLSTLSKPEKPLYFEHLRNELEQVSPFSNCSVFIDKVIKHDPDWKTEFLKNTIVNNQKYSPDEQNYVILGFNKLLIEYKRLHQQLAERLADIEIENRSFKLSEEQNIMFFFILDELKIFKLANFSSERTTSKVISMLSNRNADNIRKTLARIKNEYVQVKDNPTYEKQYFTIEKLEILKEQFENCNFKEGIDFIDNML